MLEDIIARALAVADYLVDRANRAEDSLHDVTEILHTKRGWEAVEALEWHLAEMCKNAYRLREYERMLVHLNCALEGSAKNGDSIPTREQDVMHWHQNTVRCIPKRHLEGSMTCLGRSTSSSERYTERVYVEVLAEFLDRQFGVVAHINNKMGGNGDYA